MFVDTAQVNKTLI